MLQELSCRSIEGSILFRNEKQISICCNIQGELSIPLDGLESYDLLRAAARQVKERINRGEPTACSECPQLMKQAWPKSSGFNEILLSTNMHCNLACTYCGEFDNNFKLPYDLLEQLEYLFSSGSVNSEFTACWGGKGEPLLDINFEPVLQLLFNKGAEFIQVFTNCTIFSPTLADGLKEGRVAIVTSPDSGTAETFRRIKRRDLFDKTWKNINAYAEADKAQRLIVKYIVTENNSHEEELRAFVNKCNYSNVKQIEITHNSKLYMSDTVFLGVTSLWQLAESSGIKVTFKKLPTTPIVKLQQWATKYGKSF
jgi:sulfatase maturation enzyme AslB (radical SAM superfamily)